MAGWKVARSQRKINGLSHFCAIKCGILALLNAVKKRQIMLISRNREKLINAIIYFVRNTKYCGTTKLFKLLNFLDFIHFRETGRSVTGLDYFAWPKGPVPADLFFEIKGGPKEDLASRVAFAEIHEDSGRKPTKISPQAAAEMKYFTKREKKILEELAFVYKDATAEQISEISHLPGTPWRTTIDRVGEKKKIDYWLSVPRAETEEMLERFSELQESRRLLR